jgi:glutamine synthetase
MMVPARHVMKAEGKMFDGPQIASWKGVRGSDMVLIAEASSAVMHPFSEQLTKEIPAAAHSSDVAYGHLDKDREFLNCGDVFTPCVIDTYIASEVAGSDAPANDDPAGRIRDLQKASEHRAHRDS